MTQPPRAARLLLRLLPGPIREVVAGDLEEIWAVQPSRLRYWRLTIGSLAAWWWHRLRGYAPPRALERPMHGDSTMEEFVQDLGYALRLMRRAPGFTAAIVLTLAVGIGANAATFTIVDILTLMPLSFKAPERVAFVFGWNADRQQRRFNIPLADAVEIGKSMSSLEGVAAYQYWSANVTGGAVPERVQAYRVTANTFALLGVDAALGRGLTAADGRTGAPDVAVLSHGLWQRRFGGAPSIVGQTITLDGRPHTIVGVMPRRFEFPVFNFKGEVWTPLEYDEAALRAASPAIVAIARLRPGVEYARAQAELDAVMRRLEADYPRTNRGLGGRLLEMRRIGEDVGAGSISVVLLCAVGFVLLLACANVANLLLSRAVSREREIGVRAAIGAGRARIVRQLLTESAVLSAAGALAGLVLAAVVLWWLRRSLPELLVLTMPNVLELGVDRGTLLYTAVIATVSALLFGVVPALRTANVDLLASLKVAGAAGSPRRHQRARAALMIGEVAVSVVLLVGAGLLVRAVDRLQHVDPGFNPEPVVTMTVSLPEYRYATADAQRRFFDAALANVQRTAGVQSAALVNALPLSTYDAGTRYVVAGRDVEPGREPGAGLRIVTADYFATLQIPMRAGRAFDARDERQGQPVAIVNQELARRAFGDADPIGQHLRLGRSASTEPVRAIVGVVGNVLHNDLTERPNPEIYVPFAQAPTETMTLAARTNGDPLASLDAVRVALAAVDRDQPIFQIKTMRALVDEALLPNTTATAIMALFAGLALALASIGVYGVSSYAVTQQTREFGVRLALGATPLALLGMVVRRGLALVAIGTAIGGAAAWGAGRAMAALLPSVRAADTLPYVAVCGILLVVGGAACYIPARRAMRLNPAQILRGD